jgi:membrane-associated phospholipid phosphatase
VTDGRRFGRVAVRRELKHAVALLVAVIIFVVSALPIDAHNVSDVEKDVFDAVNELPAGPFYWAAWLVMQFGNLLAVPVVAVVALVFHRTRLAIASVLSGAAVWLLAKLIKDLIERGRPAELIEDVVLRHAPSAGQGYVSGHAAVAFALATVTAPYCSRRIGLVLWIIAALVCLARVYVGAHLPLDVVGGAAFGWAVGSIVNIVFGTPVRRVRSADDKDVAAGQRRR